jgi:hypothetical protein
MGRTVQRPSAATPRGILYDCLHWFGHSAQGTADRVIVHAESGQPATLANERFAYVAGSRMRESLDVYTDNSQRLTTSFERQFDKTAAVNDRSVGPPQKSNQLRDRSDRGDSTATSQSVQASQASQGHSARQEENTRDETRRDTRA